MNVFSFAITKVTKAIKRSCKEFNIESDSIENLILHQANKLKVDNISKRLKVPMYKIPTRLRDCGNTTSASIPLTFVTECGHKSAKKQKIIVCGFRTGLAFGTTYFENDNVICPKIILYGE